MDNILKYTFLTRSLKEKLHAWADDKQGAAAVEFALIAAPFFFLIFGLLEISVLFVMSTTLEHGIGEASREIRTGSFQQSGFNQAQFKQAVCDELLGLLNCDDNLSIDVRKFASFSSTTNDSPVDENGDFSDDDFQFDPGGPDEIVLVRVFYKWDLFTPVLSAPLKSLSTGEHLLQASIAFRNEPYGAAGGGGGGGGRAP